MSINFNRQLNLLDLLNKKSHFLFGPRSTGKSSLIKQQLSNSAVIIDLLRLPVQGRLMSHPEELEQLIDVQLTPEKKFVVIDEIQKIPELLDEVHRLIEDRKLKFLLSGSSARKLKATGVNLLGGRAWIASLFPICYPEFDQFDLEKVLRFGSLPHVYNSDYPEDELSAYVTTYLNEEIRMEGLVRKIPAFVGFLRSAALSNAQQLNYTEIANDAGVSPSTIREYYSILEETLIGTVVEPWSKSQKRKAVSTGKFYFFDTGVCHTLAETQQLDPNSDLFGRSFEHWVYLELRAYLSYRSRKEKLYFWRTLDQKEVDFVVGDIAAIEVKATKRLDKSDFKGIHALREEGLIKKYFIVSRDPVDSVRNDTTCLHWKSFIEKLWAGALI